MKKRKVVVITGPTAVGKSDIALEVARILAGEIVSCDSMQIYRHMDIGSAKPSKKEMDRIPHHMIDVVEPKDDFSVAKYQTLAKQEIVHILNRGKQPIIVGGTGLYLNSLLYEMDFGPLPRNDEFRQELTKFLKKEGKEALHDRLKKADSEAADRIHPNNVKRVIRALEAVERGNKPLGNFAGIAEKTKDYEAILTGLTMERTRLYQRINKRVDDLMDRGLEEEVKKLLLMGLSSRDISMQGIGYKEMIDFLQGGSSREEAVDRIKKNTRRYAKRQITWFRRYKDIQWFCPDNYKRREDVAKDIVRWVKEKR